MTETKTPFLASIPLDPEIAAPELSNRETKRIEMLNEAAKTLNRRGVTQTSLATIANNVGISRAALYYYVNNQEDLVYQCYVRTCQQLSGLLDAATAKHTHPLEIICNFIANAINENRAEFASLSDIAFLQGEKRSIVLGLYKGIRATLADIVALGIERGQIRPCDSRITASTVLGLITWVPVTLVWMPDDGPAKNLLSKTIQDIVRIGIACDRKRPGKFERHDVRSFVPLINNVFDSKAQAAARRETLLASASWLFNQKGIDATSLQEVARGLGVTKKVIYHIIGNKDDLVAECCRRGFRFFEFMSDATRKFDGTRMDALCTSLATLAEASVRKDLTPFAPITGLDAWPSDVRAELLGFAAQLRKNYDSVLAIGVTENSIRNINAQAVMTLFPGFYEWMSRWIDTLRETEQERVPDEIANLLRLGLAPI
ncbi:MAG: TetR/AcrR family transcriptional regulator [Sphingorhabdus sp.]